MRQKGTWASIEAALPATAAALAGAATGISILLQPAMGTAGALALAAGGFLPLVILNIRPAHGAKLSARVRELIIESVEDSEAGRMIANGDGEPIFANDGYHRLFGGAPTMADAFAGDAAAAAAVRRLAHLGGGVTDIPRQLPGGQVQWLRVSLRLSRSGMAQSWRAEDITAEHELNASIHAELKRLSDFIDRAPVGFFTTDADGRFDFVNATLADWLGARPEELIGRPVLVAERIRPAPELAASDNAAFGPGGDAWLRRADGSEMPVRIVRGQVADPAGNGVSSAVVQDLTQELNWRKALRQAEEHFGHFFDFAPIGIVVLDESDTIAEANVAFAQMLGGAPVAGTGTRIEDLVAESDRAEIEERLKLARGGRAIGPMEVRLATRPERVAQVYVSRLDPSTAGVSGLLLHLIDTTEQKNLELQFAQSQKMQAVGQLAGGIAHDFNNLLTAMIGFCDLLLLRHQPGDQSFADIMQVKQNANRAANLVRQLLAFSRQQTLRPKVLDITDVLADLSNLLRRLMGETIELKMVHGRDLGLVKVDQGQFEQVIINLAVNARDAMAGGGTLTIRTANVTAEESTRLGHELMPPGEYVSVEVADTGKGIPKDIIGKIFEPFFTTKEVGAGTGLGLSTVYGIIKQTGGFVFPDSDVGKGAIFRIYLPRHKQQAGQASVQASDADVAERKAGHDLTGKGTVLLVEDEDAVRIFAARALRNKGYKVIEASSGDVALEQMRKHPGRIDVLVSDVVMPNMDGPTLAREIRIERPDLRIIFISGYAEDAFRRNLDRDAEIDFLPKPFSLKQLAGKVKEVMERTGT